MAVMTATAIEAPRIFGVAPAQVTANTITGVGVTLTPTTLAAKAGVQQRIRGGSVSFPSGGTLNIYSNATLRQAVPCAAMGIIPLPPIHSQAGEVLQFENVNGLALVIDVQVEQLAY
jgi:hypothetical protein